MKRFKNILLIAGPEHDNEAGLGRAFNLAERNRE